MNRRSLLLCGGAIALRPEASFARPAASDGPTPRRPRTRPTEAAWPDDRAWRTLASAVGGRLSSVEPPFDACAANPSGSACAELFASLKNPYFLSDAAGLTQTLGWVDAWTSRPSVYAVAAETATDVAAAVKFAHRHGLRLVVKGGGHSYQGGSNAPQSLMIWTKGLRDIQLHDAFLAKGCEAQTPPEPAVSIGAGALWIHAYQAVTTQAGRYVQGGGCTTVGVAGLIQGGGFGSFSKAFGVAASGLLEAEIVTADGRIRTVNPAMDPDLYWALKGGGGGTFGVVTRLTLRTHQLPEFFGAVQAKITATNDEAFSVLVDRTMRFAQEKLMNPHWGEQISFQDRTLTVNMVFQGLTQLEAKAIWAPFFDWAAMLPADYASSRATILALPARKFWDAAFLRVVPGIVDWDRRPGAPIGNIFWTGDSAQVGQVIHGYQSVWLSQDLLGPKRRAELVQALIEAASAWRVSLHFNKGLAGGSGDAQERAKDIAMNPAVRDAFALAIVAAHGGPAYPGIVGHEPDVARAREESRSISLAMRPLKALSPRPASYLSESDYFNPDWRTAAWGEHYPRLLTIKSRYDPDDLFIVHNGVGAERWSPDGFTPRAA